MQSIFLIKRRNKLGYGIVKSCLTKHRRKTKFNLIPKQQITETVFIYQPQKLNKGNCK